jgi:hypothetical protein
MACDLRKVLDYRTKQLEARLLLSYLDAPGAGHPLRLDHRAFNASSRHIRGFVSECSGLGMLTAASESIFAWQQGTHDLHSFDALPKQLLRNYDDTIRVRPDLLFQLPTGPVAGEARGRYRRETALLPKNPLRPQKVRLRELADWSAVNSDHPYFMSWFYIGRAGVAVDIFLPDDRRWDTDLAMAAFEGRIEQHDEVREWRFPVHEELPRSRPQRAPQRPPLPDEGYETELAADGFDVPSELLGFQVEAAVRTPQEQAVEVMNRLYESAPEAGPDSALGGIPVRGSWVLADQLGEARYEILLGVLAQHPRRRVDVRRRLARTEGRFDVCLDGRLLSVVRRISGRRPEWAELEGMLLER